MATWFPAVHRRHALKVPARKRTGYRRLVRRHRRVRVGRRQLATDHRRAHRQGPDGIDHRRRHSRRHPLLHNQVAGRYLQAPAGCVRARAGVFVTVGVQSYDDEQRH